MPELSTLPRAGLNIPAFQPLQGYFNKTPLPAPEVDTREASKIAGKSALYGSIAKVLSELPSKLIEAYKEGRKLRSGDQVQDKFQSAMKSGDATALADFKATGEGAVSYSPQNNELEQAKINALNHRATLGAPKQPIYDNILSQFGETSAATPAASNTITGSVFGMVPDGNGGWMNDPNDVTDANVPGFSANKGKYGYDIKDPNLAGVALSPAKLKAAGIDWNNAEQVAAHELEVTDANGIIRRFPIVDANGTETADFTAKAYEELGGPMERGGGHIPGLRYKIVPKSQEEARPDTASNPEEEAQIQNAATQLQNLPLSDLTAANTSGPIPMADIKPLAEFNPALPVKRPTIGIIRNKGETPVGVISTGPETTALVRPGDKITPYSKPATAAATEGRVYPTIEAIKADGIDPTGAIPNADGTYTVKQFKPLIREEKSKRLTEGEQKTSMYYKRAHAANLNLEEILKAYDPTTVSGAAGVLATGNKVTNFAAPADAQRLRQASDEFATAILRKDTGAAIQKFEREEVQRTYIPQAGDSDAVIAQKAEARKRAIEALRETLPNADQAKTPKEANGEVSGTTGMVRIKAPDGTIKAVKAEAAQKYIDKGGVVVE